MQTLELIVADSGKGLKGKQSKQFFSAFGTASMRRTASISGGDGAKAPVCASFVRPGIMMGHALCCSVLSNVASLVLP